MPDITRFYGPPGTGKTERLISIVSDELSQGVSPSEIVYVSFTKVAARVAVKRALEHFPNYDERDFKYFSTVHSVCFNLLGLHRGDVFATKELYKFGNMYGYDLTPQEVTERDPLAQTIQDMAIITIADYYEAFCNYYKNSTMSLDDTIRVYTRDGIPPNFSRGELETYIKRRDAYKAENNLFDFPDMLSEAIKHQEYPLDIKVLFIDEA